MKDKICLICHTAIDTEKPFCKFETYQKKDVLQTKAWYHVNCFRERLSGGNIQKALAQQTMQLINKVNARIE